MRHTLHEGQGIAGLNKKSLKLNLEGLKPGKAKLVLVAKDKDGKEVARKEIEVFVDVPEPLETEKMALHVGIRGGEGYVGVKYYYNGILKIEAIKISNILSEIKRVRKRTIGGIAETAEVGKREEIQISEIWPTKKIDVDKDSTVEIWAKEGSFYSFSEWKDSSIKKQNFSLKMDKSYGLTAVFKVDEEKIARWMEELIDYYNNAPDDIKTAHDGLFFLRDKWLYTFHFGLDREDADSISKNKESPLGYLKTNPTNPKYYAAQIPGMPAFLVFPHMKLNEISTELINVYGYKELFGINEECRFSKLKKLAVFNYGTSEISKKVHLMGELEVVPQPAQPQSEASLKNVFELPNIDNIVFIDHNFSYMGTSDKYTGFFKITLFVNPRHGLKISINSMDYFIPTERINDICKLTGFENGEEYGAARSILAPTIVPSPYSGGQSIRLDGTDPRLRAIEISSKEGDDAVRKIFSASISLFGKSYVEKKLKDVEDALLEYLNNHTSPNIGFFDGRNMNDAYRWFASKLNIEIKKGTWDDRYSFAFKAGMERLKSKGLLKSVKDYTTLPDERVIEIINSFPDNKRRKIVEEITADAESGIGGLPRCISLLDDDQNLSYIVGTEKIVEYARSTQESNTGGQQYESPRPQQDYSQILNDTEVRTMKTEYNAALLNRDLRSTFVTKYSTAPYKLTRIGVKPSDISEIVGRSSLSNSPIFNETTGGLMLAIEIKGNIFVVPDFKVRMNQNTYTNLKFKTVFDIVNFGVGTDMRVMYISSLDYPAIVIVGNFSELAGAVTGTHKIVNKGKITCSENEPRQGSYTQAPTGRDAGRGDTITKPSSNPLIRKMIDEFNDAIINATKRQEFIDYYTRQGNLKYRGVTNADRRAQISDPIVKLGLASEPTIMTIKINGIFYAVPSFSVIIDGWNLNLLGFDLIFKLNNFVKGKVYDISMLELKEPVVLKTQDEENFELKKNERGENLTGEIECYNSPRSTSTTTQQQIFGGGGETSPKPDSTRFLSESAIRTLRDDYNNAFGNNELQERFFEKYKFSGRGITNAAGMHGNLNLNPILGIPPDSQFMETKVGNRRVIAPKFNLTINEEVYRVHGFLYLFYCEGPLIVPQIHKEIRHTMMSDVDFRTGEVTKDYTLISPAIIENSPNDSNYPIEIMGQMCGLIKGRLKLGERPKSF